MRSIHDLKGYINIGMWIIRSCGSSFLTLSWLLAILEMTNVLSILMSGAPSASWFYYPSLNRSRCCMKGICTECFLQMKPPHSTRPTQCPFCKTSNYAVEYRGVKTKEEKKKEQIEEQRVIEAKIRMQQQEIQDEEEQVQKRLEISSSSRIMPSGEAECRDMSSSSVAVSSFSFPAQGDEIIPSQDTRTVPAVRYPSYLRQNREDGFDLDLEDIMVMEAIWLSIQEQGTGRNLVRGQTIPSEAFVEDHYVSPAAIQSESSPSGGLACAIAAMAERQHIDDGNPTDAVGNVAVHDMVPQHGVLPVGNDIVAACYPPESWIEISPDSGRALPREEGEWAVDHGSEVAEAGTSYASSDSAVSAEATTVLDEGIGDNLQPPVVGPILPESFEEQMMLAMAVSLAEARGRWSSQELGWH